MHYTCKRQPPCRGYLNTGTSEWQRLKLKLHRKYHQKQQKYLPTVFTSVSVQLPPLFSHTSHFNLQRDPNSTHKHECGAWCALRANWRNASSEQYLRCMRNFITWAELVLFRATQHCGLKTHLGSHCNDSDFCATDGYVRLPPVALEECMCNRILNVLCFVLCASCFVRIIEVCYISIRDIDSRRRIIHCSKIKNSKDSGLNMMNHRKVSLHWDPSWILHDSNHE